MPTQLALPGKFVSISGIVVRSSVMKPMVKFLPFVCVRCQAKLEQSFTDGQYTMPSKCPGEGCKSKSFRPIRADAVKIDFQKIRYLKQI